MRDEQQRARRILVLLMLMAVAAACGEGTTAVEEPESSPPAIGPVADQTVTRNTLTPATVEIELDIQDPDDDHFEVALDSDHDAVIPDTALACGPGTCELTLTPAADETAHVTVRVMVTDGSGGRAETSFMVHVVPRLVTSGADDGAGSLRQTVAAAEPGDVIGFDIDGEFASPRTIPLLSQILLDRSLTIEGTGEENLTLSGGDIVRIFKVMDSATVTLRALTMADGSAPLDTLVAADGRSLRGRVGGAVLLGPGSRLTLRNTTITGSAATGTLALGGGGVGVVGGSLTIVDSRITGNTAVRGGGIYLVPWVTRAGATIEGTTIARNEATGEGGGIFIDETTLIRDSRILLNTAQLGGGIFNHGHTTLETVIVEGNTAETGGGVYALGTLSVQANSRVSANAATESGPGFKGGGGIVSINSAEVAESRITDNRAAADGGGILNRRALTLREAVVADNYAFAGGGLSIREGKVGITASVIENNEATNGGGILSTSDDLSVNISLTLVNTEIRTNAAGDGGGILHEAGVLEVREGSTIENNRAILGGGIRTRDIGREVVVTIDESGVIANRADDSGGGLLVGGGEITVNGTSCLIVGNVADANGNGFGVGGGIYNQGGDISGVPANRVCFNEPDDIAP